MNNQNNNDTTSTDGWKKELRELLVIAMTSNDTNELKQVREKVGYSYLCYAPASLYKYYTDNDRSLNTVMNNTAWYSAPASFNDTFDCDFTIDKEKVFQSVLSLYPDKRGVRSGSQIWKDLRRTVFQELGVLRKTYEDNRNTIGITCLTESEDSLLMWAHYANCHRGMCVEYNLKDISDDLQFTPVPVIYSDDRVCMTALDINNIENEAMRVFIYQLTSKSTDWSYEKEWRIIRDKGVCGTAWDADKHGALLSMITPTSITLGCEATKEFEEKVKEYCEKQKINLYKMEKDKMLYRLNKSVVLEFDDNYT